MDGIRRDGADWREAFRFSKWISHVTNREYPQQKRIGTIYTDRFYAVHR